MYQCWVQPPLLSSIGSSLWSDMYYWSKDSFMQVVQVALTRTKMITFVDHCSIPFTSRSAPTNVTRTCKHRTCHRHYRGYWHQRGDDRFGDLIVFVERRLLSVLSYPVSFERFCWLFTSWRCTWPRNHLLLRILKSHGIATANRPHRTLRNILVHAKTRSKMRRKPSWSTGSLARTAPVLTLGKPAGS